MTTRSLAARMLSASLPPAARARIRRTIDEVVLPTGAATRQEATT
jgi:hypothetical protein